MSVFDESTFVSMSTKMQLSFLWLKEFAIAPMSSTMPSVVYMPLLNPNTSNRYAFDNGNANNNVALKSTLFSSMSSTISLSELDYCLSLKLVITLTNIVQEQRYHSVILPVKSGTLSRWDIMISVQCPLLQGQTCILLVKHYIMMLVKFLTSANQEHRIWSCDESGLCNPWPRLLGDEVVVGPSLMFRKMDPWNVIRNILQDKTNKNQLSTEMVFCWWNYIFDKACFFSQKHLNLWRYGTWILFEKFQW